MSESHVTTGSIEPLFKLDSLAPTTTPEGCDGTWHRYVIVQGNNVITGQRPGTLAELHPALAEMIDRLNERAGKQKLKQKK